MHEIITAISTAATAIIAFGALIVAVATFFIVKKQWKISHPIINHSISGDSKNDYCHLSIAIAKPDDSKFKLKKLTVKSPPETRLAQIISGPDNKTIPGEWGKELIINNETSSTGLFVSAPRGVKFTISVQCALKSDESVKSGSAITNNMHG